MDNFKTIKNYLYYITAVTYALIVAFSINAGTSEFAKKASELSASQWHKAYGPGFEIQNKDNTIWAALVKNDSLLDTYKIDKNKKHEFVIHPKEKLIIGIFTSKPRLLPKGYTLGKFVGSQPDHIYTLNAPDKTKYLTWNPEKYKTNTKFLYPQTGTYLGLTGKSDSGYNLGKNITQGEIIYKK